MIAIPTGRALSARPRAPQRGFTLVEMLVGMAVLLVIVVIIFQVTKSTADIWKNSSGKLEGFRNARGTFESVTRMVGQATLNTYFDYVDASGNFRDPNLAAAFIPQDYSRRSDLHFVSGRSVLGTSAVTNPITHAVFFQAPLGYDASSGTYTDLEGLLNACGLYVCYGADPTVPTFLGMSGVGTRYRFRLMQFMQPSQNLSTYTVAVTGGQASWNSKKWFIDPLATEVTLTNPTSLSQLADNVIALVILPKLSGSDETAAGQSIAPNYDYDSRDTANKVTLHQLPPVVEVVMVVIDEASALKLGNTPAPPNLGLTSLFQKAADLDADLKKLEDNLGAIPGNAAGNGIPLRYQIFRSAVAIRGAKWSTTH